MGQAGNVACGNRLSVAGDPKAFETAADVRRITAPIRRKVGESARELAEEGPHL
jgi:hypothetical protein